MIVFGARFPLAASGNRPTVFGLPQVLWRFLRAVSFDRYRPERHYMRGPGPKWRAKRAPPPAARSH